MKQLVGKTAHYLTYKNLHIYHISIQIRKWDAIHQEFLKLYVLKFEFGNIPSNVKK